MGTTRAPSPGRAPGLGWTGFDSRVIAINPGCPLGSPGFLEALMVHEYGHLLCLCSDHNLEDSSSIMNPVVVEGNQITEDDKWRVTSRP